MRKCIRSEFSTTIGRKYEWSVVENKKIVGGKTNSNPPLSTAILREGGGKIKKTYWPPVVLYTGSFEPNHATGLLHETVDFKKNQQDFTAVLVKSKTTMAEHNTILHVFRLSVKIKKLQSIHCCGVGEFAKQTKTDKQPKTKQRTIR